MKGVPFLSSGREMLCMRRHYRPLFLQPRAGGGLNRSQSRASRVKKNDGAKDERKTGAEQTRFLQMKAVHASGNILFVRLLGSGWTIGIEDNFVRIS